MTATDAQPAPVPAARPSPYDRPCPVCGGATTHVATMPGKVIPQQFVLRQCAACGLSFVANPCTDYARIYDEAYYYGKGADPLVDYVFEMDHPKQTVRYYEWRGIVDVVRALKPISADTRWLDFGCGNGGLVRHVRDTIRCDVRGFDVGWITTRARAAGLPIVDEAELDALRGTFDVVTAVEVLEHVADPLDVLRRIRGLLKPGGLFFYTTGNAAPFRHRLAEWRYVRPDIHVSYFEPRTLERALRSAGFEPEYRGRVRGFTDVIRYKVLKNLGRQRRGLWERGLPWGAAARLLDRKLGISAHPVGWVPKG
jgi:SAM-dependent methyltransferase